jgi:hypothetical protein
MWFPYEFVAQFIGSASEGQGFSGYALEKNEKAMRLSDNLFSETKFITKWHLKCSSTSIWGGGTFTL